VDLVDVLQAPPTVITPQPQSASPLKPTAAAQLSLIQRFRTTLSSLSAPVSRQFEASVREVQQSFEQANQALLGARLDREESFTIDESYFAKSPLPKPSPVFKQSPPSFTSSGSMTFSTGSGGSKDATPGKAEVPLLHRRMKHLIAAMEKFVPHDGLTKLLIQ
jgi:hypothetical protein